MPDLRLYAEQTDQAGPALCRLRSASSEATARLSASMVMSARSASSVTLMLRMQRWSYTAVPKASASRMATRSGSSAGSGVRTQRVW
jgi:hypothetical protein